MNTSWKNKKVFITGHSGFIGVHLVNALKLSGAVIQTCDIDLLQEDLISKNYIAPDYIFHLAARVPVASDKVNAIQIIKENVSMTKNVLEFGKKSDAKMIVVSSSHVYPNASNMHEWKEEEMVYGSALSSYGISKQEVERCCIDSSKEYGMEILIVRLANIYGPGDVSDRFIPIFIRKCLNRETPLEVMAQKEVVRDFLYIDDAVAALTASIDMLGCANIVNIGSGAGVTIQKVAEIIKKKTGFTNGRLHYQETDRDFVSYNVLNITQAKKLIKYNPSVSLEDGIEITIDWWKKQGN